MAISRRALKAKGMGGVNYELVETGHFRLHRLGETPSPLHQASPLTGDYSSEASGLVALNHREASEYRWRNLWRPTLSPARSDFPADVLFWASHVSLETRGAGLCLVNFQHWRSALLASADIWVTPGSLGDAQCVSGLVAVCAERAAGLGASSLDVYVPAPLAPHLAGGATEQIELGDGDPWFRRMLE